MFTSCHERGTKTGQMTAKKQCPVIERFCAKVLVRYPFFQAKAVRLMFLQVQVDEFNDSFT